MEQPSFFEKHDTYYVRTAIGAAFSYFSEAQKEKTVLSILKLPPDNSREEYYDYDRFLWLKALPNEEVMKHALARKAYQEGIRKFGNQKIKPEVHFQTRGVGSPISSDATQKMSLEDWRRAFKKYVIDSGKHYKKYGHSVCENALARQFEALVKSNPIKYFDFVIELAESTELSPEFFHYGVRGFIAGGMEQSQLTWIVETYHTRSFRNDRMVFLEIINKIQSSGVLPESLLDILIYYALHDRDPEPDYWVSQIMGEDLRTKHNLLTNAINTVRGNACQSLVLESQKTPYLEKVFCTIEKACFDHHDCVKAGLLGYLYVLIPHDSKRVEKILHKSLSGKVPGLISIGLSTIRRLINAKNFERFIPYFDIAYSMKDSGHSYMSPGELTGIILIETQLKGFFPGKEQFEAYAQRSTEPIKGAIRFAVENLLNQGKNKALNHQFCEEILLQYLHEDYAEYDFFWSKYAKLEDLSPICSLVAKLIEGRPTLDDNQVIRFLCGKRHKERSRIRFLMKNQNILPDLIYNYLKRGKQVDVYNQDELFKTLVELYHRLSEPKKWQILNLLDHHMSQHPFAESVTSLLDTASG